MDHRYKAVMALEKRKYVKQLFGNLSTTSQKNKEKSKILEEIKVIKLSSLVLYFSDANLSILASSTFGGFRKPPEIPYFARFQGTYTVFAYFGIRWSGCRPRSEERKIRGFFH